MKTSSVVVHTIFVCDTCGESWDNYLTAQKLASAHARKYKHRVTGEVGRSVWYEGDKEPPRC